MTHLKFSAGNSKLGNLVVLALFSLIAGAGPARSDLYFGLAPAESSIPGTLAWRLTNGSAGNQPSLPALPPLDSQLGQGARQGRIHRCDFLGGKLLV